MPMPKLRKSPPELIAIFESVMPGPPAVPRKMFGYPAAFVNGNLFMSLFQEQMILRLPEELRAKLLADGWSRFEPMPGRPMGEYMALPESLLNRDKELRQWVIKALTYGESLKPKAKANAKSGPKTKKRANKK
jgi:TfoX/Sxy family transcriptional regulator of competence genes